MGVHRIDSPHFIYLPRKTKKDKRISLNLNWYRNAHHREQHEAKLVYTELMKPVLEGLGPLQGGVRIHYKIYYQNKRLFDVANIGSIVDKFFCDALTGLGILEEDDYHHVTEVGYSFGGIDKLNPRVEISIHDYADSP